VVDDGRAVCTDVLVEPWLINEDDIAWMHDLAKRRYSDKYDFITTEGWMRNIVLKGPLMFNASRLHNAFCVSMLSLVPWLPSVVECNVVFICAEQGCMWEAIKLLRSSIEWGRIRRCSIWRLSSDTDYDLKMIASRLGAEEISPRYVVRY
jgi:hypothetical protein